MFSEPSRRALSVRLYPEPKAGSVVTHYTREVGCKESLGLLRGTLPGKPNLARWLILRNLLLTLQSVLVEFNRRTALCWRKDRIIHIAC